ncbi:hypothetical protein D3C73_1383590 [compost metagenome]
MKSSSLTFYIVLIKTLILSSSQRRPFLFKPCIEIITLVTFVGIINIDPHLLQFLFEFLIAVVNWQALLDSY